MKKKILSVLLTAAMAGTLFTACGNPEVAATSDAAPEAQTQTDAPAASADAGQTEIQTVDTSAAASGEDAVTELIANTTGPVDLAVWAAEEDQDMVKGWCDDFAAKYPDVTFNFSIGVQSESPAKYTILIYLDVFVDLFFFV